MTALDEAYMGLRGNEEAIIASDIEWASLICKAATIRPRATILPVSSKRLDVPVVNCADRLVMLSLMPHELLARGREAFDIEVAVNHLAHMEDYVFLQGDGIGKPLGIFNAPGTLTVSRQKRNAIMQDDLTRMMLAFLDSFSPRGIWMLSKLASQDTIEACNKSGFPVIVTELLPKIGQRGDAVLADWKYYLIGQGNTTAAPASFFNPWGWRWSVSHFVDGMPWTDAPIEQAEKQVSPFVILGDVTEQGRLQ